MLTRFRLWLARRIAGDLEPKPPRFSPISGDPRLADYERMAGERVGPPRPRQGSPDVGIDAFERAMAGERPDQQARRTGAV